MPHNLFPVYPDSFPVEAAQVFLGLLKGQKEDLPCYIHAGWIVVGFGLGQLLPHDHEAIGSAAPYAKEEVVAVLEKLSSPHAAKGSFVVDWKRLAKAVLQLIDSML